MKIVHAEFTNFRLLRDLILDFSTDPQRKLTVIRAENESGKTTILTGLQWALYGDSVLPGGGRQQYRLHPLDWDRSEGDRVSIAVEIDFEVVSSERRPGGQLVDVPMMYRLRRATSDRVKEDGWEPGPTSVELFQMTDSRSRPIDPPEARIRDELPQELREIFFTDGDRTLSFIEGDVSPSTKQRRVREAIQSLLGLELIENAQGHVRNARSEMNKQVRGSSSQSELNETVDRIASLEEDVKRLDAEVKDADEQYAHFDEAWERTDQNLQNALRQGNREQLQQQLVQTRQQMSQVDTEHDGLRRQHSNLFRDLPLSRDLAGSALLKAMAKLNELHNAGQIPNNTIPVLEERLSAATCICGESLQGDDQAESRRRAHIHHLIEASREADEFQKVVSDLYYSSRAAGLAEASTDSDWISSWNAVSQLREDMYQRRDNLGVREKAIEAQIKDVPDTNIRELQKVRKEQDEQRDRFNRARSRYRADLNNVTRELQNEENRRDQMLRRQEAGGRIMANLEVAQDIETVLANTYKRLTTEELEKVGAMMNDIFLEMIGADPQQGALIRGASVTQEFEIVVYGTNETRLNPDRDLNGASRRALTLAFILALTKVSEVDAPNVIDTPLGMMSGYVKQSVLRTAIRESSQLILFLTRSEINDCEAILDAAAGSVITLTNPAHYPIMLENDPGCEEMTVLKCDCNHRRDCPLCRRKPGVLFELAVEPV